MTLWLAYDCIGGRARLQWDLLTAQRECLHDPDPPDRLVFDADPTRAAALIQQGYLAATSEWPSNHPIPTSAVVSDWHKRAMRLREAREAIERWRDLRKMPDPPAQGGGGGGAGIFGVTRSQLFGPAFPVACLERHAATGPSRIIIVQIATSGVNDSIGFSAIVVKPATLFSDSEVLNQQVAVTTDNLGALEEVILAHEQDHPWARVFSATVPEDTATFALAFEIGDRRGSIEGKLQADDTIVWTLHSPPPISSPNPSATMPSNEPALRLPELPEPVPPKLPE